MLKSYEEVKEYLKAFSPYSDVNTATNATGSHKQLGTFHYGDEDKIIEDLNANARFPILWLPQIEHSIRYNDGSAYSTMAVTLAVLHNSEVFDNTTADQSDTLCNSIAVDVVNKFIKDAQNGVISADLDSFSLSPITHAYHANLFGWELKFTMNILKDTCVNPLRWN